MNTHSVATRVLLVFCFIGVMIFLLRCTGIIPREKQIFQELAWSGGQFTTKWEDCDRILKTQDWCSVVQGVVQVTRPEWVELFPKTQFYLVRRMLKGSEEPTQDDFLIIEQGWGRFTAKTFDQLLNANNIAVGEDNRELVAKAFALITIPNYLENEIKFTKWEVDTSQPAPFDYCLTAWTRIQGLELKWCYTFSHPQYRLIIGGPGVLQERTGDFVDISAITLPHPLGNEPYSFLRR